MLAVNMFWVLWKNTIPWLLKHRYTDFIKRFLLSIYYHVYRCFRRYVMFDFVICFKFKDWKTKNCNFLRYFCINSQKFYISLKFGYLQTKKNIDSNLGEKVAWTTLLTAHLNISKINMLREKKICKNFCDRYSKLIL